MVRKGVDREELGGTSKNSGRAPEKGGARFNSRGKWVDTVDKGRGGAKENL